MNLLKNIPIKILSVISALLLWFFVVGVENYVHVFPQEVPIKVINLGQNVSIANEINSAKVRYKGEAGPGSVLAATEFDLYIDAAGLAEGNHQAPVRYISKNPRVVVVAVEPSVIDLQLEAITSKDISLKAQTVGSPAKDYEIKNVKLDLEKVKLSGAAKAIADIKELNLKITLDGSETADFSRKITLEAPVEWKLSGKTVSFDPAVVQVEIEIRKIVKPVVDESSDLVESDVSVGDSSSVPVTAGMERKTLMAEVIFDDELKSAVKEVVPANILVTVEGKAEEIALLSNSSIKLEVRNSEVVNGSYKVSTGDVILPPDLELKVIELSPAKISLKF